MSYKQIITPSGENSIIGGAKFTSNKSGYKYLLNPDNIIVGNKGVKMLDKNIWDQLKTFNLDPNTRIKTDLEKGVWTVQNIIRPEYCQKIVDRMKEWSENHSRTSFGTGKYTFHDSLEHDPQVIQEIQWLLEKYTPRFYCDRNGKKWVYSGITDTYPWAKYTSGQEFGIHQDTASVKPDGNYGKFTCLIYLNDDFEGGQTVFYYDKEGKEEMVTISPTVGTALFFDIDLYHKGEVVKNGEKYWIGFEICYREVEEQEYNQMVSQRAYQMWDSDIRFEKSSNHYWFMAENEMVSSV